MGRPGVVLVSLLLSASTHVQGVAPPPAPPVPWAALHFQARKLGLSATSVIRSEVVPAATLAPLLREPPGVRGVPLPAWVVRLTVETDLPVGRDEQVQVWLDPATFAALQADKQTYGKRQYVKLHRYVTDGYYEWRYAPANQREAGRSPETWSARREGWARSAGALAGGAVVDPYTLLYIVSATQLHRPGGRLTTWIVSRGRLVELSFANGGLTRRRVDHVESWGEGERRHRGDALVRLVQVTAAGAASAPQDGKVDLGFLGMQGELTIALDADSGIPVEVSGRTRAVGQLVVRLTRAELTAAPTSRRPTHGDT